MLTILKELKEKLENISANYKNDLTYLKYRF